MAGVSEDDEAEDGGSGTSLKAVLLYGLIAILLGGGSGFGLGYFMGPDQKIAAETTKSEGEAAAPADTENAHSAGSEHASKAEGEPEKSDNGDDGEKDAQIQVTALDPIVTNLSDPADTWIRLELVLATKAPFEAGVADQIHQDLFAYVRAMRLSEMAGPSAFISLKAELLERAKLRSDGMVTAVYIKTLLYE